MPKPLAFSISSIASRGETLLKLIVVSPVTESPIIRLIPLAFAILDSNSLISVSLVLREIGFTSDVS